MKIGVFDSGIGGLTVLKELINKYPYAHYIYYGDTKNLPYGNKTRKELRIFSQKIIDFLITKEVDLVIVACGTVSSNVYTDLIKLYNIPIIDILTPTIDYIKKNNLKEVGVLGTKMTIKSKAFGKDIKQVACPKLVPLIENNENLDEVCMQYLKKLKNCQNIILGCTHYPLALSSLKKYSQANFINMGECIIDKIEIKDKESLKVELYFSKITPNLINNVHKIIGNYKIELK